jgi:hypothetical protein
MNTTLSLDEEVRLYSTNIERERYESMGTLYGIILTLEYLERAYGRDSISADQWEHTSSLTCKSGSYNIQLEGTRLHAPDF